MTKKIKEQIEEVQVDEEQVEEIITRDKMTLQDFMNDMDNLGSALRSRELKRPVFDIGAPEVHSYLLWLILGELMMLNNKVEGQ